MLVLFLSPPDTPLKNSVPTYVHHTPTHPHNVLLLNFLLISNIPYSVHSALHRCSHATHQTLLHHTLCGVGTQKVMQALTLVLAQDPRFSSPMTFSTLSLLSLQLVPDGRRRAAENARFSLTLSDPIIRSSCTPYIERVSVKLCGYCMLRE